MSWHVQLRMSCSSVLHITHLLILVPQNAYTKHLWHLSSFSFTRNSITVHWQKKCHWLPHFLQHTAETLIKMHMHQTCIHTQEKLSHYSYYKPCSPINGTNVTELWLWLCMTCITKWTLVIFSIFTLIYIQRLTYRLSQEEWTKLRESVPYVELYRYNLKDLYPKLNGYGDNDSCYTLTDCQSHIETGRNM